MGHFVKGVLGSAGKRKNWSVGAVTYFKKCFEASQEVESLLELCHMAK
jgi:hypothetical protein